MGENKQGPNFPYIESESPYNIFYRVDDNGYGIDVMDKTGRVVTSGYLSCDSPEEAKAEAAKEVKQYQDEFQVPDSMVSD